MDEDFQNEDNNLEIQYLGQSGYTSLCLFAIDAILSSGWLPEKATIVSTSHHKGMEQEDHLFLFWDWWHFPLTVVPSGFASGYTGEGPKGFSLAICMIRSKGIPIDGIYVRKADFEAIDQGRIDSLDNPLYLQIKSKSEPLTSPWPQWVPDTDELLLKRDQLWRRFYWRKQKTDFITEATADVDMYYPKVGRKLRMAMDKLKIPSKTEEWQSSGILIRDAWIEFSQKLSQNRKIDTSEISPNDVKKMLSKIGLDDEILKLAQASFDLSLKNQHDREISEYIARSCVITTALIMQALLRRYMLTDDVQKRLEETLNE